jgi:hypothetical protein
MDTETSLDIDYLPIAMSVSGFHGEIHIINPVFEKGQRKGKPKHHAEMATELANLLTNEVVNAIILDSAGMYVPIAESEGEIGDANMGRRAMEINQWCRRCLSHLITHPDPGKIAILVNHKLAPMGPGRSYSPGGRGKGFAANTVINMFRKDNNFNYGAFHAKLNIEKLRWGGTDRERDANIFIIPGVGVAKGMTAVIDAVEFGLAERGSYVKYKDGDKMVSCGYRINELVEADMNYQTEPFEPFHKVLEEHFNERVSDDSTGDGQDVHSPEEAEGG